jgi:hypothetical protein
MRPPGVVIDTSPDAKRVFVGCPSIAVLSTGAYVASHSWFGPGSTEYETVLFTSHDEGKNWKKTAKIEGQWWSTLFVHEDALYIMGVDCRYGRVIIRRSEDSGKHWTTPLDKRNGLLTQETEYHTAPVPVVAHKGRIWRAFERRAPAQGWCHNFHPFVMSASVDSDLLSAENWRVSDSPGRFRQEWRSFITSEEAERASRARQHPAFTSKNGWLEGNVVVTPEDRIVNILRVHEPIEGSTAAVVDVSQEGRLLAFDPSTGFVRFPGGCVKFTIRRDPVSEQYWSLTNYVHEDDRGGNAERTRNSLALIASRDLATWNVCRVVLHYENAEHVGFQYVDWQFEGNDIIAVSRTAFGNSDNCHNANYLTFHRIHNFRSSLSAGSRSIRNSRQGVQPSAPADADKT